MYGMETCEPADTPMVEKSKLDEDPQGKAIDPTRYHGMIGTLMYLIASRPDLVFLCACVPAFVDADHAGCQDTRKSTSGSMQLLGDRLVRSTNVRLETTVPQKEETFQVVIDLVKNSSCFKAFTISTDVLEIFMQQFWTILDTCPRVEGVNFTDVPDDDETLAFLIKLGYKGPLYKHTNMFGMFYKENVDYPELIWEDLAYQIDHEKEKRSWRENMPFPDSQRLKFVRIGEDYQEYGLPIPETMLTEAIKQSESYQMFIKYSTGQICPKKSRGKGSQGKKTVDASQETLDVSKESESGPESVKRKTSSKRRVKKKVILFVDDNIISDDPDTALELGKSISQTEAEEAEAARQVHATHARIVTESVPEPTKRRKSGKVTSDPPKKLKGLPSLTPEEQEVADIMQALKESKKTSKRQPCTRGSSKGTSTKPGVPDESAVVFATSSEGNGTKPGVPDEEKEITKENVILEWGSEQESEHFEEDKLDDKEKDDKEGDVDDEDNETESNKDDINKYKIRVRKDEDEEMLNAEVNNSDKGDEEITDAAKANAEKTSEVKDDAKKTELPPSSSSLSVSSGFGDQFLKLSSDYSLASTVKDTTDAEINSLLEVKIQSEVSHTQSPSKLSVPVFVISEPTVLTPTQESPSKATVTTLPPLFKIDLSAEALAALKTQVPSVVDNYFRSKVGDVFQKELKKHMAYLIQKYSLQQIPESSKKQTPTVNLEQGFEKSASEILKSRRNKLRSNKSQSLLSSLQTRKLFKTLIEDENAMDKGVADTVQDHKRKHHDDEDPPAGPNQGKKTKRRRTKESESSNNLSSTKETPKGKASSKGSKSGKSASTKEPVKDPIVEVIMDDAGDNVVHDDDQPQDTSKPKTAKTPNLEWFSQPPRPPTPDLEWNKRQVVLDQPEKPWFNQMVSATKDPPTFNNLMATPINFSKYVLNGLKIDNLTQDILLGPAFNLLKGTCSSSIELEYNIKECFNGLTDILY
ncbi:retrovirus-related pol polyprotein from transposon TNT 1-94 [Tanacetum coccineum]